MLNVNFSIQALEYFLLIFTRVATFIYIAPFYGTNNVPRRVKTGLSFMIAMLLYQYVVPHMALNYNTLLGYAVLVIKEATVGLLIGFACTICLYIIQFAGSLMDMDIGLSMVSLFDSVTNQSVGFTGSLYQYAILLILVCTDMHHWILKAFVDSYKLIPTGGVVLNNNSLLQSMISFMSDYFSIGFRIYLPVFAAMLLLNAVLGVLAKVAPQMNMFVVGMQLKILVGLAVLFLTVGLLPGISDFIFKEMKVMVASFVKGMYVQ